MVLINKILSLLLAVITFIFPCLGEKPRTPENTENDPQYVVFMVTNIHYFDLEPYVKEWMSYSLGKDYQWTERPSIVENYGGPDWFIDLKIKIKYLFK